MNQNQTNPLSKNRLDHFLIAVCCLLFLLPGCNKQEATFTEIKRIDEKLTRDELVKYFKIVNAFPDKKLPELPSLYAPLPQWKSSRTLSVEGLVQEERELIQQRWKESRLAARMQLNQPIMRVLNRFKMTPEQFVGLTHTLAMAYNYTKLSEKQDLKRVKGKGVSILKDLENDDRTFSTLSNDVQHELTTKAGWITRIDRAERLSRVPQKNIKIAMAMNETLENLFPKDFGQNALDTVVDRLDEFGIPFEETPSSGTDSDITWTRSFDDARIGNAIMDRMIVEEKSNKK